MKNSITLWFNVGVVIIVLGGVFFVGKYSPHHITVSCKSLDEIGIFYLDPSEIEAFNVEKDIFYPEKKEVEVKAVDQVKLKKKKIDGPSIVYKGVMIWDGKEVGIFYDANQKKTLFLRKGEFIKDYKILDITAEEVVLSKKGGLSVVTLKIGGLGGL